VGQHVSKIMRRSFPRTYRCWLKPVAFAGQGWRAMSLKGSLPVTGNGSSEALELKHIGNGLFSESKFEDAATTYTKAIELDPTNCVYWGNRSQAFYRLKDGARALADAEKCIELAPHWSRGYSRKINALQLLNRPVDAMEICRTALELEPDNRDIVKSLLATCFNLLSGKFWGTGQGYNEELEFRGTSLVVRWSRAHAKMDTMCSIKLDPIPVPMRMTIRLSGTARALPYIFRFTEQGLDLCEPNFKNELPADFSGTVLAFVRTRPDLSQRNRSPTVTDATEK